MHDHNNEQYQYAFLDSGAGGLPYLAQLRELVPDVSCVYLADTAHFPYGEKKRDEVITYATGATEKLIEAFDPEIIVVACNTISVAALAALRERFPIPFVGTVPAIKVAAEQSKNRSIGLLATDLTVNDPYTDNLISSFASDCRIVRRGDSVLVTEIENGLVTAPREQRLAAIRPALEEFRNAGVDTIVLACTHFLNVTEEIRELAGPDIAVIDSRNGVVQQALRLIPARVNQHNRSVCYTTGGLSADIENRYRRYAECFDISWGGVL